MAVVRSLGIGEGRKSAGMLTYRNVRGRTIASRRVITNPSNTAAQAAQRSKFGDAAKWMMFILAYIKSGFERSKFGSARNNYLKSNPNLSAWGGIQLLPEVQEGVVSIAEALITSNIGLPGGPIERPGIKYVARGTAGGVIVSSQGKWETTATWGEAKDAIGRSDVHKGVDFQFASPLRYGEFSLEVFTYPATPGAPVVVKKLETQSDFESSPDVCSVTLTDLDEYCGGLSLSGEMNNDYREECVFFPVLRVHGKVVSNNVFTCTCTPAAEAANETV